jgi:hypothetical protein
MSPAKPALLLLSLVAVLSVAGWWWQRGEDAPPPPSPSTSPGIATAGQASALASATDPERTAAAAGGGAAADRQSSELAAGEMLQVRVLDFAGQPAVGVPIDLRQCFADGGEYDPIWNDARDTDAAGLVAFANLQKLRRGSAGPYAQQPVTAFAVVVQIHGLPSNRVVVPADLPLPQQPVELRLPPTGSLSLRFVLDGQPVAVLETIQLHAGPAGDHDARSRAWQRPVDADGWAHFPHVPLQPQLFASSTSPALRLSEFAVEGPLSAGASVRRELDLGSLGWVLRGRVLADDGSPLASTVLRMSYGWSFGSGSGPLTTDAEGRFLLVWSPPSTAAGNAPVELDEFALVFDPGSGAAATQCRVAKRTLHRGNNDLGDLRLLADPIVCAGRLLGFTGDPQSLSLRIERGRGRPERLSWHSESETRCGVAPDGSFAVTGVLEPGRLRLQVAGAPLLPVAPVEFQLGQRGLEIPVVCGQALAFDCLLPPGGKAPDLVLSLRDGPADVAVPPDEEPHPALVRADRRQAQLVPRGGEQVRAEWSALVAGTYTLHVALPGHPAPLLELPGIAVPMPAAGDARVQPLDLRGLMRWLQIDVRVAGVGKPVPKNWLLFPQPQPVGADVVWGGSMVSGNRGQMLLGPAVRELLVVGEGFVPQRVEVAGDAVSVVMQPWVELELLLAPGTELPAGTRVGVALRTPFAELDEQSFRTSRSGGSLGRSLQPQATAAEFVDGRATLLIGDGVHRLTVTLWRGNLGYPLPRATPGEVVAGGPVTVVLDAGEVRAVAERLPPDPSQGTPGQSK